MNNYERSPIRVKSWRLLKLPEILLFGQVWDKFLIFLVVYIAFPIYIVYLLLCLRVILRNALGQPGVNIWVMNDALFSCYCSITVMITTSLLISWKHYLMMMARSWFQRHNNPCHEIWTSNHNKKTARLISQCPPHCTLERRSPIKKYKGNHVPWMLWTSHHITWSKSITIFQWKTHKYTSWNSQFVSALMEHPHLHT